MARFETGTLFSKENLKHPIHLSGKWIDQAHRHRKLTKLILDLDSLLSETYGHQEGTASNGYLACMCYHPSSCSTSSATWSGSCSDVAITPAPSSGDGCCCW